MDERRRVNGETVEEPAGADEAPAAPQADRPQTVEALQAEVERLTAEAERHFQQFLRTAADLENYRKQAARQREDAVAQTRRAMIAIILGVVDTLERALEHAGTADEAAASAIADGIRLAHRQVLDTLRALGVRPMEVVGQPFDPRVHEAVEAVPAGDGAAPGVVVAEVQRGYLEGDEVLRPARVRVAQ
ncbi:MAG: nucleotide exchange factor GrpE [Armatimonadota bacterium]|nr:nucleotide exchange factor GrpE [Armatimonadota bacterium]MDR7423170.1 nucleotide exchange factor GrpE [Armatimonadota bacterium]MDR7455171.1 nucleotide exchange factor GrpE [Armatimonadota bacterium]MDR7496582.1 nucleotide exchange factor GrpE [Armatimonadota bacterium]MDR7510589.1 nucleotide exchange factor GrpE [Armatimonadota bacterium]